MPKTPILLTLNDRMALAETIISILNRGNSVQIKLRKDEIIVMEERRRIKQSIKSD